MLGAIAYDARAPGATEKLKHNRGKRAGGSGAGFRGPSHSAES